MLPSAVSIIVKESQSQNQQLIIYSSTNEAFSACVCTMVADSYLK